MSEVASALARNVASGFLPGTRPIWWKSRSTLWQARLWLGRENGGPVSLGLYRSEREAHAIWLTVTKRLAAKGMPDPLPLTAWEILIGLPKARLVILPRWVFRTGERFSARARIKGEIFEVGDFQTARDAFLSLWSIIKPLFQKRNPERIDMTAVK